jgi:hypothetical protein
MCNIDRRSWVLSAALCLLACSSDDPKQPATQHLTDAAGAESGRSDAGPNDAGATDAALPIPEGCPLTPPTSCANPAPHYSDIQPIFEQRCFSCHDGTGQQWGLTSYEHVADWFAEIRAQMIACSMPPLDSGITMPTSERMKIVQWIRCGYPE